jgi:hypothetical protein
MAWNGRHLIIGFAAGDIPRIPANLTLLKGCSVVGVFWGSFTQRAPETSAKNVMELLQMFAEGKIAPKISQIIIFTINQPDIRSYPILTCNPNPPRIIRNKPTPCPITAPLLYLVKIDPSERISVKTPTK